MVRIVIAASTALLLGACATVEQQQVADADQAAEPAPAKTSEGGSEIDMNETVCRKEQTTGTRFARRVCKTRQEWEDEAKAIHADPTASAIRRSLQTNRENN